MIYKNGRDYYCRNCWYSCSGAIIRKEIIYDKTTTTTAEELNLLFRATVLQRLALLVVVVSVVVVQVERALLLLRVKPLRQLGGGSWRSSRRFSELNGARGSGSGRGAAASEDKSLQKLINRIGKYLWFPSSTPPTYCNGYINNNNSLPYDNPR